MTFDFSNDEDNANFLYNNVSWDEMNIHVFLTEADFFDNASPHANMVKDYTVIDYLFS